MWLCFALVPALRALKPSARSSASAARLRYVHDSAPGIRRQRRGRGFVYVGLDGRRTRESETLQRIRSLAIPPAWVHVWICPYARVNLKATGRDARGRKQYRYHPLFRRFREATKFENLACVARVLPRLRGIVARDIARDELSKRSVLAAIVRVLDDTGLRIGNEEYARTNRTYGVASLRAKHVHTRGSHVLMHFRAKAGADRRAEIDDACVARVIRRCHGLPSEPLFMWIDAQRHHHRVHANDVNAYLRAAAGCDLTAKDLRTWNATVRMVSELARLRSDEDVRVALRRVADAMGHTPAICKRSYVHLLVLQLYDAGSLSGPLTALPRSEPFARKHLEKVVSRILFEGAGMSRSAHRNAA